MTSGPYLAGALPVIANVIVTPDRMKRVHRSLESLLEQTRRPDRLVLWVKTPEGREVPHELPPRVRRLRGHGLELRAVGSVVSAFIPTHELAREALVLIADSERRYGRKWIESMCEAPARARPRKYRNGPYLSPGHAAWRDIRAALAGETPPLPEKVRGSRGVVTAAGTPLQLANACMLVRRLRHVGCDLPVEIYHTADEDIPAAVRAEFGHEARFVPIRERGITDYGIKPWALWVTSFERCLWLDSDNLPLENPAWLLSEAQTPIVWPDLFRWNHPWIYEVFPELPSEEPEFETGQLAIDTIHAAPALWRAILLNREFRDCIYTHMLGDKDTFRLAFRLSGVAYRWAARHGDLAGCFERTRDGQRWVAIGMVQSSPRGGPLFVHRTTSELNPDRAPHRVSAISTRATPHTRGRSSGDAPEAVGPPPHTIVALDDWACTQLPDLRKLMRSVRMARFVAPILKALRLRT
jgi:hypothetical protein